MDHVIARLRSPFVVVYNVAAAIQRGVRIHAQGGHGILPPHKANIKVAIHDNVLRREIEVIPADLRRGQPGFEDLLLARIPDVQVNRSNLQQVESSCQDLRALTEGEAHGMALPRILPGMSLGGSIVVAQFDLGK